MSSDVPFAAEISRRRPPSLTTPSKKKTLGTVIVTGGASGLGAAIADAVARHRGTPVTFDVAQPRRARDYDHHLVDVSDRKPSSSRSAPSPSATPAF